MTHASLKYVQLLTQDEIFQGDLFMPTKYQRDGPKNDQDCVQHSGPKCVGFVDENQSPTRQVDFGEAQVSPGLEMTSASSIPIKKSFSIPVGLRQHGADVDIHPVLIEKT